ncbi:TetR/AcrR family transcriptional regulator [Rhodococcus sp. NPDC055112]
MSDAPIRGRAATPSRRATAMGRPKMPLERIVLGAVELVDAHGADALTLRALAQQLGSSTATLYRHVDSRAELVGHVVDHLIGEIDLDREGLEKLDWSCACERLATAFFDVVRRHPNAAPLLIESIPTGPHAMAFRELTLSILLTAGFPVEIALRLAISLARFTIGFAMQVPAIEPTKESDDAAAVDRVKDADPRLYPSIRRTANAFPIPLEDEFHVGLDLLLRGMRDYITETSVPTSSAPEA